MTMMSNSIAPTVEDARIAKESSRKLASLAADAHSVKVQIPKNGGKTVEETIALPKGVMQLLLQLLTEMSKGNAVTLMPIHAQLTTQQAADILGVSRPFIVKEIREGKLKYQAVGTHRRIAFKDLMDYKQKCQESHDSAMNDLVQQAQDLNLGY